MPTLNPPQLVEKYHISGILQALTLQHKRSEILSHLEFYREHGQPTDFGGRFANLFDLAANEVIDEIEGVLVRAALIATGMPARTLISTLQRLTNDPWLVRSHELPEEVEFAIAPYYQREDETAGTFWIDILGLKPEGFNGEIESPTDVRIRFAADAALKSLKPKIRRGRPPNPANAALASRLASIFSRYGGKIARQSSQDYNGQVEDGAFYHFLSTVLEPLQNFLIGEGLETVSATKIARLAASENQHLPTYPISPIEPDCWIIRLSDVVPDAQ